MAATSNMRSPEDLMVGELLDPVSLPEDQRLAFYSAMLAIAAADGIWGEDELDLIFQNVDTDGLSELSRKTFWDYLVDTPPLTDCLACFASSRDGVRCTLMVYLIEIALADRLLDAREDEALLQARRSLRISPKQLEAIERYICEVGLIRAHPPTSNRAARWLTYGMSIVAIVSICVSAVYFSSAGTGVGLREMLTIFALSSSVLAMGLGAAGTILTGTVAWLTGRWVYRRHKRKRLTVAGERQRRAQLAVRNLQDAVGYLSTKAPQLTPVGIPTTSSKAPSDAVAARLRILQQMLDRRQAVIAAISS